MKDLIACGIDWRVGLWRRLIIIEVKLLLFILLGLSEIVIFDKRAVELVLALSVLI